jgi:carbon-monoxide dehydrogenase small subunit
LKIDLTVNGEPVHVDVDVKETLLDLLRNKLNLKGAKKGCEGEGCGACTVILDGKPVYSCMYPAFRLHSKNVVTVEGLGRGQLDAVQREFINRWAFQCGYCTPGFIMAVEALIRELHGDPGRLNGLFSGKAGDAVRDALTGHICRCTGYEPIVEAATHLIEHLDQG